MASFFAPGEPYYNSSEEVVDISSTYSSGVSSGVTLTYNPSTGQFSSKFYDKSAEISLSITATFCFRFSSAERTSKEHNNNSGVL